MAKDTDAEPEDVDAESEDVDTESEEPFDAPPTGRTYRWLELRRSSDDRLVAGVAGGIGEFFSIDPVIVRIAFIFLSLMGGFGVALYLASWLLVPLEDTGSILTNFLRSGTPRRFRNLVGIVLIAFGLLVTAILSRNVFEIMAFVIRTGPFVALVAIVVGIGLVLWPRRRSAPPPDTPAEPLAAPTTTTTVPPMPSPSAAGLEWPERDSLGQTQKEAAKESWRERRVSRRSQYRGQSTVTLLTLAALLVFTGVAVLVDRLDLATVPLNVFFAIAVLIVAVGLLVSVFVGRNWALIVLGLILLAPLAVFSDSNVSWWSGFGYAETKFRDVRALDQDTQHGIGSLVVDLRSLDRHAIGSNEGAVIEHNVDLTLGEVTIKIPADLRVRTNAKVAAGTIQGGEDMTVVRVQEPRYADGDLYCVMARYDYGVDEEMPDFGPESVLCRERLFHDEVSTNSFVDRKQIARGVSIEAVHTTHREYDLEVNVEIGVGRLQIERYRAPIR